MPANPPIVAIKIQLEASHGASGTDDRPDNPLARALRNLLQEGQRFTSAEHATLVVDGVLRWLGMFVLSEAGRIVFFPGFAAPFDRLVTRGDGSKNLDEAFAMDHITIDADRRRWHFTQHERKRLHRHAGKTLDVGEDRTLCFGFTTSEPHELRPVSTLTLASANAPDNVKEVQARIATFDAAVRSARNVEIRMPPAPPPPHALHFGISAAKRGAPRYTGPAVCTPPLGPKVPPGIVRIDGRTGAVALGSELDIQIIAGWIPFRVDPGFAVTGPV